jgi:hypothetical protein
MHTSVKVFTVRATIALVVILIFMTIRFDIAIHLYRRTAPL